MVNQHSHIQNGDNVQSSDPLNSPLKALENLIDNGLATAKKAKKLHQNLSGINFYANKLVELRAEATNTFRELSVKTSGDVSALAELIDRLFSPDTSIPDRTHVARELKYSLLTTWKSPLNDTPRPDESVFPMAVLAKAKRGYLLSIGRQMNGCYSAGHIDACAVMLRRLIEVVIIDAYEENKIEDKIKGGDGNYLQLTNLVDKVLQESTFRLSRNTKKYLPKLKEMGHLSAHGKYYHAQKEDLETNLLGCRIVIEEFLHHAKLI